MKRSRSRSPLSGRPSKAMDYPWEDEEILRTLNCKACNVSTDVSLNEPL